MCNFLICCFYLCGQPLQNLKWMDLSHSSDLKRLPDLSTATNLLSLDLSYCTSLVELHSSVGNATNLLILSVGFCNNLVEIPSSVENIPNLNIFFAGCSSLVKLPSRLWNNASLGFSSRESFSSFVYNPAFMWMVESFLGLDSEFKVLLLSGSSDSAEYSSFIKRISNLCQFVCCSNFGIPLVE